MSKTPDQSEDANQAAARIVRESTGQHDELPLDVEAAWRKWSSHIQKVDERGMALLKAAFEAGYGAGTAGSAASSGRQGGLKGGRARANSLSPEQRSAIAKKAAAKRWGND